MSGWENYTSRMEAVGITKRDMWVTHTKASISRRLLASPSCRLVKVNGVEQYLSVVHKTKSELDTKRIAALPGEHLAHGGLVDFAGHKWLITAVDVDDEVYEKGFMRLCNHVLRWIGQDGKLKEKWCVVEDGTKYLIGEKSSDIMTLGDARIAVTVGRDEDTREIHRGQRFLIDDPGSGEVLAYEVSKPNRFFNVYDNAGVFRYILTETNVIDEDNLELRIADYAKWRPPQKTDSDHKDSDKTLGEIVDAANKEAQTPPDDNKEGWL